MITVETQKNVLLLAVNRSIGDLLGDDAAIHQDPPVPSVSAHHGSENSRVRDTTAGQSAPWPVCFMSVSRFEFIAAPGAVAARNPGP